jgi:hypothetical protein
VTNNRSLTRRGRAKPIVPGRRGIRVPISIYAGIAAGLLSISAARADDDLRAVLQQVREQLKQDQLEIKALKGELAAVRKQIEKPPVVAAAGVPPPTARNVVVTQQPGNLPGRSVGPPGTASGVGTPGAPMPEPAAPISSARDTIKVSLSGQVDRALLRGDDGKSNAIRNVDNIISSTRFRLVGEGRVDPETTLGTNLEMEIRPNLSNQQTITQATPQAAANVFPTIRQAELFVAGLGWGDARIGFGSTASYLTNEFDLSGTFIGHYVGVAEQDGGFAFRQRHAALVPGGAGGKLVLSPAGAFGPAVGSVFNNFGGLGRDDRIRYDTPVWEGFQFSTSYVDGGSFDAALRMGRTFGEFRVIAAVAGADATHRPHTPTTSLGYAGVPAGFPGGSSLAGTNANPSGPNLADVTANGSKHFDGSFSILHNSGISLTMSGGLRDPRYLDPLGKRISPNLFYTKLGWQHDFFSFGRTAFSVDFANQDEVIFNGDEARSYAVAVVQNIDSTSTELFASAAYQTLTRTLGASFHPILAMWTGARIRF